MHEKRQKKKSLNLHNYVKTFHQDDFHVVRQNDNKMTGSGAGIDG